MHSMLSAPARHGTWRRELPSCASVHPTQALLPCERSLLRHCEDIPSKLSLQRNVSCHSFPRSSMISAAMSMLPPFFHWVVSSQLASPRLLILAPLPAPAHRSSPSPPSPPRPSLDRASPGITHETAAFGRRETVLSPSSRVRCLSISEERGGRSSERICPQEERHSYPLLPSWRVHWGPSLLAQMVACRIHFSSLSSTCTQTGGYGMLRKGKGPGEQVRQG